MIKHRKIYEVIKQNLDRKEFDLITGARQTGKSTLLKQLYDELSQSGHTVFNLTFEDPAILNAINIHPEKIFDFIPKPDEKRVYLLLDEVQYASNPSNFLKLLFDLYQDKLKIIATGSSAFYIDKKFKDSLVGRKQLHELYTLDFDEFIYFKTKDKSLLDELENIRKTPAYISFKRIEIDKLFLEYLSYGGYPAVVLAKTDEEKNNLLKELLQTYIKRDIQESNILHEDKFFNLLAILSHQTGNLLNVNELSRTLKLSVTSVENYLYVLQKCFHICLIKPYYKNIRKELTKMPKIYFHDLGFRNILMKYFEPLPNRLDKGQLLENYLFIRLRQKYNLDSLNFWRTTDGNEVDFLVTTQYNRGIAYESKFSQTEFKSRQYQKFNDTYPDYPLQIVSYQSETPENNILKI